MVGGLCPLPIPCTTDALTGVSATVVNSLAESLCEQDIIAVLNVPAWTYPDYVTTLALSGYLPDGVTATLKDAGTGGTHIARVELASTKYKLLVSGSEASLVTTTSATGLHSKWVRYDTKGVQTADLSATWATFKTLKHTLVIYGELQPIDETLTPYELGAHRDKQNTTVHPAAGYLDVLKDSQGDSVTGWRELELVAEARALGALHRNADKVYFNANPETADECLGLWQQELGFPTTASDTAQDIRDRAALWLKAQGLVSGSFNDVRELVKFTLGKYYLSCEVDRPWTLGSYASAFWTRPGVTVGNSTSLTGVADSGGSITWTGQSVGVAGITAFLLTGATGAEQVLLRGAQCSKLSGSIFASSPNAYSGTSTVKLTGGTPGTSYTLKCIDVLGVEPSINPSCTHPGQMCVSVSSGAKISRRSSYIAGVGLMLDYDSVVGNGWLTVTSPGTSVSFKPNPVTEWVSNRAQLRIACKPVQGTADFERVVRIFNTTLLPLLSKMLPSQIHISINVGGANWTLDSSLLDYNTELA